MKIIISVNCLKDIGGIGTSAINLINEIHNLYDITLCVTSNFISSKYKLPDNVKIINGSDYLRDVVIDRKDLFFQNLSQKIIRNIRRIINHYILKTKGVERALRKIKIEGEYDVAIAFTDFMYSRSECKCYDYFNVLNNIKAKRKIAWIHNHPTKLGWTHDLALIRFLGFDKIVNVSYDCKKIFDSIAPELTLKSEMVYNMYDIESIKYKSGLSKRLFSDDQKLHFVTVARIQIAQKRIDRIIECCRRLKAENLISFDWTLVGTSGEIDTLKANVENLGLQDLIHFAGLQTNPYPYMLQADAFVLSSEYEGLSMTIKEAQILGTPTFVTDFGAAKEAVLDNMQGEICPNSTEGLYLMMKSILLNSERLNRYRQYLKENPVDNNIALKQFHNVCTK